MLFINKFAISRKPQYSWGFLFVVILFLQRIATKNGEGKQLLQDFPDVLSIDFLTQQCMTLY
jgi:hypothetical protein